MKTQACFARFHMVGATSLLAVAMATGLAGTAHAQQTPSADAASQEGQIEEIVVTARYRSENLQRTPLAITAVSATKLEERGATNILGVASAAPNVVLNQLGAGFGPTLSASIRGLAYNDFKAVQEATVPIYVDDIVLGRNLGSITDLLDLERVEVLRGPQGTLFGKNAIGGVIRMISKKPGPDTEGSIEGTIGNNKRLEVRASFNTAIAENLFARFSFSAKRRDGFVKVVDFVCDMKAQGTPQLAGIGDGVVGWNTTTNTPIMGVVGSAADNAFALPTQVSPNGSSQGCQTGEMGGEQSIGGRAAFLLKLSDQFELNLTGDVMNVDQSGPPDYIQAINPAIANTTAAGGTGLFNRQVALPKFGVPFDQRFLTSDPYKIYGSFVDPVSGILTPNVTKVTNWGVSGTLDWKGTNELSGKLIVGFRKLVSNFGRDSDGSPLAQNHTYDYFNDEQFTVEGRLSGELFDGVTEWTAGAFYFHADDINSNISIANPYPANLTGDIDRIDTQTTKNYAGFLHLQNHLTDALTLTAGVRYTHDEKAVLQRRLKRDGTDVIFPGAGGRPASTLSTVPLTTSANRFNPMVNLAYQWSPNVMTYLSYQRGFRGSGFNPRPTNLQTQASFGPEDLDAFEFGVKTEMFDRRLRINADVFLMIYKDLQLNTTFDTNPGVTTIIQNAGKARIPGVEIEMTAEPVNGWTIEGSVGYLGFKYLDLGKADPAVLIAAGQTAAAAESPCITCRSRRAPEWTLSGGTTYKIDLGSTGFLSLHGDWSYQTRVYYADNNNLRASQAPYALFNARITWENEAGDLSVAVFGTNLTDRRYAVGKLDFYNSFSTVEASWGRPREFGLSVKKKF
ncbi:MAG: TonB-dependent receptor [Sphingobium sp.]|nr:TonB-dependent receptor [Sphingobium sp.]